MGSAVTKARKAGKEESVECAWCERGVVVVRVTNIIHMVGSTNEGKIRAMGISINLSTTNHLLVPTHPAHAEHPLPKPHFRLNHSPQSRCRRRVMRVRNGHPADLAPRGGGGGHAEGEGGMIGMERGSGRVWARAKARVMVSSWLWPEARTWFGALSDPCGVGRDTLNEQLPV